MGKKTNSFREVVDKVWPKTKIELEKGIKNTKKILDQGEKYLKEVSERGAAKTKKLSLGLKKEKLYYDLGKIVAQTEKSQWDEHKKIQELISQIRSLQHQITKIK